MTDSVQRKYAADEPPVARQPAGFARVVRRELRTIAHSRFYLLYILVLPLASFGFFGATFYREVPRDLPIAICDGDDSSLSREAIRMLDASSSLATAATVRDVAEGADLIRRGKAYAIVLFPANVERDAKRGEAPAITVYYNNQWLLTSGVISRAVRDSLGTLSAKLDVQARVAAGESPAQAMQRQGPIRLDQYTLFNPYLNYRPFLLPVLFATMVQLFLVMATVRAVGSELRYGTAGEWLAASGGRVCTAVAGKLLPYTVAYVALTWFMLILLVRVFGVPLYGNVWILLGAGVLFVLAYQSMACSLVALTSNLRLSNSLAAFYAAPAFAFAGVTYPVAGMPMPARLWSWGLPLCHYMKVMIEQTLRGSPASTSLVPLVALALFIVIPPLCVAPRLGRLMRDPQYWGRQ